MATITGQSLITTALTLLLDPSGVRWTRTELLGYLNQGQREAVIHRPEVCTKNTSQLLAPSTTKQSLPDEAVSLVDVVRNMGVDGTVSGRAIRLVSRDLLDLQVPNWHSMANTTGDIRHYMFDPRDPKHYYIYPKAPATAWYVELVYSANPVNTNDSGAVIGMDDIYANALVDYMLYRAYSKDSEYASPTLAAAHYETFLRALGAKTASDIQRNPNLTVAPFNPNTPGSAKV